MTPTKRNHINPCFWTALWNADYYAEFIKGKVNRTAREQKVFCLNFNIPKILPLKVEDVHYIEGMGLAFANDSELFQLENLYSAETNSPFDKTLLNTGKQHRNHILDIENHFTVLEEIGGYEQVMKTIRKNKIETEEDRMYIGCFLVIHQIRGINFFQSLHFKHKNESNPTLNTFIDFKQVISNENKLYEAVSLIVKAKWTLYTKQDFSFPLSDSPIMNHENFIWAVLSPKHLLEINLSKEFSGSVESTGKIDSANWALIKKLIIRNSFQSIIFSSKQLLEKMKKSRAWISRKNYLEKIKLQLT